MESGDFSLLAENYRHRPGYSLRLLRALAVAIGAFREDVAVADIGAGTGKLAENLLQLGFVVQAVEPNSAMRKEGRRLLGDQPQLTWHAGSAERTGLAEHSIDWLLMASAFHWTDQSLALQEFHRVLKPGGFLTLLWNPRDLGASRLQQSIESKIQSLAPQIRRVSSGAEKYTGHLDGLLLSTGAFGRLLFMEAPHCVKMSRERFLGAWRSVNDIQAQAGPELFERIMAAIEAEIAGVETIEVPYRTRAWTVQAL